MAVRTTYRVRWNKKLKRAVTGRLDLMHFLGHCKHSRSKHATLGNQRVPELLTLEGTSVEDLVQPPYPQQGCSGSRLFRSVFHQVPISSDGDPITSLEK